MKWQPFEFLIVFIVCFVLLLAHFAKADDDSFPLKPFISERELNPPPPFKLPQPMFQDEAKYVQYGLDKIEYRYTYSLREIFDRYLKTNRELDPNFDPSISQRDDADPHYDRVFNDRQVEADYQPCLNGECAKKIVGSFSAWSFVEIYLRSQVEGCSSAKKALQDFEVFKSCLANAIIGRKFRIDDETENDNFVRFNAKFDREEIIKEIEVTLAWKLN